MDKVKNKKRVFVGLSGGVDSSVAAALLKKQGYDVAGVFMRFWKPRIDADFKTADERGAENSCCSVESEAAARLVAGKLSIPFYIFNFAKEFKRAVVDYFLAELSAGRTPNPCVVCNPEIKFGLFLARAKKLGADYMATGHYARLRRKFSIFPGLAKRSGAGNFQFSKKIKNSNFKKVKLYQTKDKQKDQSYFLYRLNQEQLSRVIFPLGEYTKDEVYQLAKKWRLPHQAHQSFDICFVADYREFLERYLKLKPGKIVDLVGKALGQHQGLSLYTIGQKAGLGGPGPFFVVKKDIKKNILYVSNNERDLYQKEMLVEKVNWLNGQTPRLRQGYGGQAKLPLKCFVKIRYQGDAAEAIINNQLTINNKKLIIKFKKSQRAITPGQSAVFYGRGGEVLGGGVIL